MLMNLFYKAQSLHIRKMKQSFQKAQMKQSLKINFN